jgi:large subunit ribosomal protein L9
MEIILLQDVANLGSKNDIVTVKPGYGRNYLIPKKYAVLATESNRKVLAENIKQQAHKQQKLKEEATKLVEKLKSMTIKIGAKAGENGKIFGSVNTIMLADTIKNLGITVERKNISITDEPIKQLGKYKANVKLHKEVHAEIEFEVVEE